MTTNNLMHTALKAVDAPPIVAATTPLDEGDIARRAPPQCSREASDMTTRLSDCTRE